MKRSIFLILSIVVGLTAVAQGTIPFSLQGIQSGDKVSVTISSSSYLVTQELTQDGDYAFADVPVGMHYIKVEANGYNLPDSKAVVVNADGSIEPKVGIQLSITKMSGDGAWTHSWHEDGSISGYTTTAHVNQPAKIVYLGKTIVPSDVPSESILREKYGVMLSDNGIHWTQEYAYRLLETLKTFPGEILGNDTTVIQLTKDHLEDDIVTENVEGGRFVTVSADAFVYANPFLVTLDGVRGRFFSKRLHHAMVNMVTDYGNNRDRVNKILVDRFGCSIYPPSYEELTAPTTVEPAENFQEFVPRELVEIINMFEEMPEGFHKIKNLKYLIRRLNGHPHPIYPQAAAVTWPIEDGYIEFMESAFNIDALFETQRLIIHEKTHMLWAFTFSDEIKNDWIQLGGWYKDPNSSDGWATTKNTEFVSAYAHAHNPNEDMAESVAFYVKNPDKLKSRSLPKYEFIRDRIMHGTRYISKIREDLTFEVLNLFPDYDYPGKIKSLDVQVEGKADDDKTVVVDIVLNHMEGFNDGAARAFLRMTSPIFIDTKGEKRSQYYDLWLYPVDGDAWHLKGSLKISKHSKAGYWTVGDPGTVGDIVVIDEQDNQRFEGSNDFVWNMYVNNSLEDLESPVYEKGSLRYNLTNIEVDGRKAQNLEVIFKVTDDTGITSTYVRLGRGADDSYSHADEYGTYDAESHEAHVNFLITEYYPSDDYFVEFLEFDDVAKTRVRVEFSDSPQHEPRQLIHITSPDPDTQYPELDLNRIFVYAEPTHPEAPDGETLVTINYYARDNKSGLGIVFFRLRDPQGIDHDEYHYHRNFYTNYFEGDPTVWERYTVNIILPKGSAPGIWGLSELTLQDKALNWHTYNFVETLIFEPDDNQDDYVLFAEMTDANRLNFDLTGMGLSNGYNIKYRIISEVTGQEITGVINETAQSAPMRRSSPAIGKEVDISSLPAGKVVVIVEIKDGEGNTVAVRSRSIMKVLQGDANGDGEVNVSDIVEIVNYIMNKPSDKFVFAAADMNDDGEVNVTDIVMVVSIIMTPSNNAPKRAAIAEVVDNDQLEMTSKDGKTLSLNLQNEGSYVASQFDIVLSAGQTIEGIQLNSKRMENHQMTYTKTDDNRYKVVIYSLNNAAYKGQSGELLNIKVAGSGDVSVEDILFVTAGQMEKNFPPLRRGTTGISLTTKQAETMDIYSIDGRLIRKQAKSTEGLEKGLYIINGKKQIIR